LPGDAGDRQQLVDAADGEHHAVVAEHARAAVRVLVADRAGVDVE
jgi:hypothetical protein